MCMFGGWACFNIVVGHVAASLGAVAEIAHASLLERGFGSGDTTNLFLPQSAVRGLAGFSYHSAAVAVECWASPAARPGYVHTKL